MPGPPCTTSTPDGFDRMISSCSAWIVATMSAIRPVRLAPTAASSAASLVSPLRLGGARGAGGVEVEDLVVDAGDLATAGAQVPTPAHALGRRGRGRVEGPGRGRAPVHQQRVVLVVLVEQAEPADVADLAVLGVEPPEREPVLGGAQRGEPVGVDARGDVALGERLRGADRLVVQHLLQPLRGLGATHVEPFVEHRDVATLVLDPISGMLRTC